MSGHSKWSTIKRKKGAADAKRGKLFSKLAKQITVAARQGQGLEMAVDAAKAANMPKDNIERAIQRGTGADADAAQIEEVIYEAYGPGGAAILITALTDNRNRTIGNIRAVVGKYGLRLADSGSVQYLFEQRGILEVDAPEKDNAQLMFIDAGATGFDDEGDTLITYTAPQALMAVKRQAETAGLTVRAASVALVAKTTIETGHDDQQKLVRALEALDDLDDIQSVETNAELSDRE